ncbi:hypothetical protein VTL71DRAFT_13571 [Oculimacula yallundae]|uniref:SUN domain-containing protein n=1 Tax=Oculimacula yallundae TaxID=86028 RepID=A0ABR4CKV1_9HELO
MPYSTALFLQETYLPQKLSSLRLDSARQSEASDDGLSQYSQFNDPLPNSRSTRYPQPPRPSIHTMSTRRSTRGASRQASSRGASPAISTSDIPATPRRTSNRRSANALPAVGARQSTAYGSNTIPPPAADAPPVARGFSEVLEAELNPVSIARPKAPSSVGRNRKIGRSETPNASERSFNEESLIFQNAGIESSPISEGGEELPNIPELPEPNSDDNYDSPPESMDDYNGRAQRQKMEEMAANLRVAAPASIEPSLKTKLGHAVVSFLRKHLIRHIAPVFAVCLLAWATYALLSSYSFQNALPQIIKHPVDAFLPSDVQSINRRLTDLEYKVHRLSSTNSALDPNALKTIRDMLPDYLVVKEDKNGNIVIPDNFWHALRDKIRKDNTLSNGHVNTGSISSGGLSIKDLEKQARNLWDQYLEDNEARMGELDNQDITRQFPGLLKQNHVISKTEVLTLIQDNWDDNQQAVMSEMSTMTKKLNHATREISQLRASFKDESDAIANEVLKRFIPSGQIDALAAANLKSNLNHGLSRINFLSKGTGAVIDIINTSPTHVFPSQNAWFPKRTAHWMMGNSIPVPNGPDAALTKWEEYGDCWCSPSSNDAGSGPSLAILMGESVYPDQVVVEHILPNASLEPGAAPREMELLAYIPDPEVFRKVSEMSHKRFQTDPDDDSLPVEPLSNENFVRIATWTYERNTLDNIQAFAVQVDLKALGAHTNKVIIRSKNNWGEGDVDYTCLYRVRLHGEVVAHPGLF